MIIVTIALIGFWVMALPGIVFLVTVPQQLRDLRKLEAERKLREKSL